MALLRRKKTNKKDEEVVVVAEEEVQTNFNEDDIDVLVAEGDVENVEVCSED